MKPFQIHDIPLAYFDYSKQNQILECMGRRLERWFSKRAVVRLIPDTCLKKARARCTAVTPATVEGTVCFAGGQSGFSKRLSLLHRTVTEEDNGCQSLASICSRGPVYTHTHTQAYNERRVQSRPSLQPTSQTVS